ncbi:MAG: hypothetical protein K9L17_05025 [Clostridiales bacterium]|nr:hypothetical protein [Clostridiales bacterium]MCF8022032.1 hypothetical protein [Clostridiales bacterium]
MPGGRDHYGYVGCAWSELGVFAVTIPCRSFIAVLEELQKRTGKVFKEIDIYSPGPGFKSCKGDSLW